MIEPRCLILAVSISLTTSLGTQEQARPHFWPGNYLIVPNALAALAFIEANDFACARIKHLVRETWEGGASRATTLVILRPLLGQLLFLVRHCPPAAYVRNRMSIDGSQITGVSLFPASFSPIS
jgi:hypothetical protein